MGNTAAEIGDGGSGTAPPGTTTPSHVNGGRTPKDKSSRFRSAASLDCADHDRPRSKGTSPHTPRGSDPPSGAPGKPCRSDAALARRHDYKAGSALETLSSARADHR